MSHFDTRAKEWDKGSVRVQGAAKIASAINDKIELTVCNQGPSIASGMLRALKNRFA